MKKYYYSCDGGSLLVGVPSVTCEKEYELINILNHYGDGCFKCYDMNYSEFDSYVEEHKVLYNIDESDYKLVLSIHIDNGIVYDYDCVDQYFTPLGEPLFKLNGLYHVYVNYGKIYFVKRKI